MTAAEVLQQYQDRLRELSAAADQARLHSSLAGLLLFLGVALFLTLGVYAIGRRVPAWTPAAVVPLVIAAAASYRHRRRGRYRAGRLRQTYLHAVERLQGDWAGGGESGEEFADPAHPYASDLNVFGEGSLFELLCTARTANGKRGLAEYLSIIPSLAETLARQEAVQELKDRTGIREQIAVLGEFEFLESRAETFTQWLDSPALTFNRTLQIALLLTSSLAGTLLLGGMSGLILWKTVAAYMIPLLGVHSAIGLMFRTRVNRMADWLRPVSLETQVLREGLRLMEAAQFQSPKLRGLMERMRGGSVSVRRLERLLNALNERNKEWFYLVSLVLMAGTQLSMAVENWRMRNREALRGWLEAWAEFEALNALANYAYENPENSLPQFGGEEAAFEAEALGHPLLPVGSCVRNDVALNARTRFYLVSGSNMAGKSTLLRAVGLNAVLALAGAPVRARRLRLSAGAVCASLSIVDSLLNGKSKFLTEMDKLRQALETAADGKQVLFLIDEILSGTNSQDRRIASEAVVRTLIERGAIGMLSTHDLALSEIAELEPLHGLNVHMASRSGGGPMDFDYLLKPGVTKEANALAIAKMAGVPV
ncbi:MAG TPA: hypothetical protein VHZ74_06850 [Bryobacteraceae bacterium]|nr:hypothetical protein [Bryobacteraceae bacterium]